MDVASIIASVAGAGFGGLSAGWVAKIFLSNYIRANDKSHESTKKDLRDISTIMGDLKTEIAVINTKLDQLNGIGKEVIVLQELCKKHGKDINAAHERIRSLG